MYCVHMGQAGACLALLRGSYRIGQEPSGQGDFSLFGHSFVT